MGQRLNAGFTKRSKLDRNAAARASAALNGTTAAASQAAGPSTSATFVPVGTVPKRRRLPREPKIAYKLSNAPALTLPGLRKYSQPTSSKAVAHGRSAIQQLFASTDKNIHGLTPEMLALVNASGYDDDPFGLGTFEEVAPRQSRHRRRRLAQHQRWREIISSPSLYHAYLQHKYGVEQPGSGECEVSCLCQHTRRIAITLADWNGSRLSHLDICQCTSAAERLLARGYFPCAPKCPSVAFSTQLLDFISIHSLHVAPNFTAWADTLEYFWARKGAAGNVTGRLRKRLSSALTWYQALDNCAEVFVTELLPSAGVKGRKRQLEVADDRVQKRRRVVDVDDNQDASACAKLESEDETAASGAEADERQSSKRRPVSGGVEGGEPSAPVIDESERASLRLQRICPLCFGGERPSLQLSPADIIVCLDANFAQKRRRTEHLDPELVCADGRFLSSQEIAEMEEELAEKRKRKPKKPPAGIVAALGDAVLDDCEHSFIAAQEAVTKASKNYYADTGLMALLCRHDRVLWLANMNTPGERQHFALALLRRLGRELPRTWHIGVLYDIGCQLARSVEKWGLLEELADRLTFGVSVFHAYGHQWACQIVFHPRKRNAFGLSDGEGCERFWSAIRHLIACLRVSGFHRRLFVLDRQAAALDALNQWKFGSWLRRRYLETLRRSREAADLIAGCGLTEDDLGKEWDAQVKAHLVKQQRQNQKAGDRVIDEILVTMGTLANIKQQLKGDRAQLRKAHRLTTGDTTAISARIDASQAAMESAKARIAALNATLGTEQCRRLESLKGNAYLCARVNARALRSKIRQNIVSHKFERRKLERAYRQQVLQAKDHSQTKDLVQRRERTISGQIQQFNELVDEMTRLARQGKKPSARIPLPRKLDPKKIFRLDVDDDIWQEDPGLGPQDEGDLPRWQTDDNVKRGISALLEKRRCSEEMERVEAEARGLGVWCQRQEEILRAASEDGAQHASVRAAVKRRLDTHTAVAETWARDLRAAGLLEQFAAGKAEVRTAQGMRDISGNGTVETPGLFAFDNASEVDGSSTEVDSDDASDAYSEPPDPYDPLADFVDVLTVEDDDTEQWYRGLSVNRLPHFVQHIG